MRAGHNWMQVELGSIVGACGPIWIHARQGEREAGEGIERKPLVLLVQIYLLEYTGGYTRRANTMGNH